MTTSAKLKRAAAKAATARADLEATIRDARAEGMSLRTIADATGMSHETVRRIGN